MFRRDFFKMLGAAAVGVICAPLVKLLPARETSIAYSIDGGATWSHPLRIGDTIRIKKPARYVIKQADDDLKAVTGLYASSLDAEALQRYHATADLKFLLGDKWPS